MEDIKQILTQKIQKSQALLASWRQSKSRLHDGEFLKDLNNILDNGVLAALKNVPEIHDLLQANCKNKPQT